MDAERTRRLRELLEGSGWVDRTREFAASLRRTSAGGLLLVGTPTEEPWHLAAHLDDLVHDRIVVPTIDETLLIAHSSSPDVDIDTVQHLVSVAAGESATRANMRSRLASFLERVSGPPASR